MAPIASVCWGLRNRIRERTKTPPAAVMWVAIVASAVAFGVGHLPALASTFDPHDRADHPNRPAERDRRRGARLAVLAAIAGDGDGRTRRLSHRSCHGFHGRDAVLLGGLSRVR